MLVEGYVDPSCTQPPVLPTVPVAVSTRALGFCPASSAWYSLLHCRTRSVHTVSLMAAICVDILTPYAMLKGREDASVCVWGVTLFETHAEGISVHMQIFCVQVCQSTVPMLIPMCKRPLGWLRPPLAAYGCARANGGRHRLDSLCALGSHFPMYLEVHCTLYVFILLLPLSWYSYEEKTC